MLADEVLSKDPQIIRKLIERGLLMPDAQTIKILRNRARRKEESSLFDFFDRLMRQKPRPR